MGIKVSGYEFTRKMNIISVVQLLILSINVEYHRDTLFCIIYYYNMNARG